MSGLSVAYRAPVPAGATCMVRAGMDTPRGRCIGIKVETGTLRPVTETHTGQTASLVEPENGALSGRWTDDDTGRVPDPDTAFQPCASRDTRFADRPGLPPKPGRHAAPFTPWDLDFPMPG